MTNNPVHFIHQWKISNLHQLVNSALLKHPRIKSNFLYNFDYIFKLYPNGIDNESSDYISLKIEEFFASSKNESNGLSKINFRIWIINTENEFECFQEIKLDNFEIVIPKFMKRDYLLLNQNYLMPNNVLTIFCEGFTENSNMESIPIVPTETIFNANVPNYFTLTHKWILANFSNFYEKSKNHFHSQNYSEFINSPEFCSKFYPKIKFLFKLEVTDMKFYLNIKFDDETDKLPIAYQFSILDTENNNTKYRIKRKEKILTSQDLELSSNFIRDDLRNCGDQLIVDDSITIICEIIVIMDDELCDSTSIKNHLHILNRMEHRHLRMAQFAESVTDANVLKKMRIVKKRQWTAKNIDNEDEVEFYRCSIVNFRQEIVEFKKMVFVV